MKQCQFKNQTKPILLPKFDALEHLEQKRWFFPETTATNQRKKTAVQESFPHSQMQAIMAELSCQVIEVMQLPMISKGTSSSAS